MVASSPIQYKGTPADAEPNLAAQTVSQEQESGQAQQQQQQQSSANSPTLQQQQSVQSPDSAADIHAYQPPWKTLVEYAAHQRNQLATTDTSPAHQQHRTSPNQASRQVDVSSPRYQQLIGQVSVFSDWN